MDVRVQNFNKLVVYGILGISTVLVGAVVVLLSAKKLPEANTEPIAVHVGPYINDLYIDRAQGGWQLSASDIPAEAIQIADNYIIGKTSAEYFKSNYQLVSEKGVSYRDKWYSILYKYRPLSEMTKKDQYVSVRVHDSLVNPNGWVASIENGVVLAPKITPDQAIKIAESESNVFNSSPTVRLVLSGPKFDRNAKLGWLINIPVHDADSLCASSHETFIDIATGEVIYSGVGSVCD